MQNSILHHFRNSIIVFLLLLSSVFYGEWLSEKNPSAFAPKVTKLSGNTNSHGFYKPSIAKSNYPRVSVLYAQKKDDAKIKITWDKPSDKSNKLKFAVYTSETAISDYKTFLKAKMIGFVSGKEDQYINSIKTSGTFYYAVSVISNNTEYFIPEFDQSYTSSGISMNQKPIYTVKEINVTYDQIAKIIKVKWKLPPNSIQKYKIIRSERPILFPTDIISARVITETPLNTDEYNIPADKEGFFWYAVLSISKDNRLSKKLIQSENVTRNELVVKFPKVKLEVVKNLKAIYNQTNNRIEINWSRLNNNKSAVKLFQNRQESIKTKDLLFNSKLIKTFLPNSTTNSFTINKPETGNWFFAAVTYNEKGMSYDLFPATNTLIYPVVVASKMLPSTNSLQVNPTNLASTNSFPINDGKYFITNEVIIFQTNEMNIFQTNEINIMRTNIIEFPVVKTNFIDIPRFETNIIYLTNSIISNVTITNEVATEITITNEVTVTNVIETEPIDVFITNVITFTNEETITNLVSLTNEATLTNMFTLTNQSTITNMVTITNEETITNIITITNKKASDNTVVKQPTNNKFVSENKAKQLRRVIRKFYKNNSSNNLSGYNDNIRELLKIRKNTNVQAIKAQCTLFIGRVYFQLKKYNTAIKYFINIQNSLPDESNIWIRRCIRYMR